MQSVYYDVKTSAHTVFKIVMRSPIYLVARRMYIYIFRVIRQKVNIRYREKYENFLYGFFFLVFLFFLCLYDNHAYLRACRTGTNGN